MIIYFNWLHLDYRITCSSLYFFGYICNYPNTWSLLIYYLFISGLSLFRSSLFILWLLFVFTLVYVFYNYLIAHFVHSYLIITYLVLLVLSFIYIYLLTMFAFNYLLLILLFTWCCFFCLSFNLYLSTHCIRIYLLIILLICISLSVLFYICINRLSIPMSFPFNTSYHIFNLIYSIVY